MTKHLTLALGDQLARDIAKSVTEAFGLTFGIDVKPGRYVIGSGAVPLHGDVSGIVGITQERLEGTFTVCFKIDTLRTIIPRLLGPGIDVTVDIAADAMGEITNMVFSRIKTELNERGHSVRLSLPSVVRGPSHFINHLHEGRYMLMPFDVEGHEFQVHLAIHRDVEA
jgi:CheY-specific phosphatase CheX